MPCSTAHAVAAQSRSAKTRAISTSSARRSDASYRARKLLPKPETPTAILCATPLLHRPAGATPLRPILFRCLDLRIPRSGWIGRDHEANRPGLEAVLSQAPKSRLDRVWRHDCDHPQAAVEGGAKLSLRQAAKGAD